MSAASHFTESDSLDVVVRVQMKQFGAVLDTRRGGAKARGSIEREMRSGPLGAALVLDFRGVRDATVSFIDECIGVLLAGRARGYLGAQPVLAVNANEDLRETIALTLGQRKLALLHLANPPELLGGDETLNQTLRHAWGLGRFTAGDLAGNMGLSPQAVNNRLKALVGRGALHRALVVPPGGGKEFLYLIPGGTTRAPKRSTARSSHPVGRI